MDDEQISHPSSLLIRPIRVRAFNTLTEITRSSHLSEEDFTKLILLVTQMYLTTLELVVVLDPEGERIPEYEDIVDVEHFDEAHKERILEISRAARQEFRLRILRQTRQNPAT